MIVSVFAKQEICVGDKRQGVKKDCPWLPNKIKDCTWHAFAVNHVCIYATNSKHV